MEAGLVPFGRRTTVTRLATLELACPPCGEPREFALRRLKAWIVIGRPLFSTGAVHDLRCEECWSTFDIRDEDADWLTDPASDLSRYSPRTTRHKAPGERS